MLERDSIEDFLGEEVVDLEGVPIGVFACYWEYEAGRPVLFGIDLIAGLSKRTHVAPAKGARPNAKQSYIRVGFSKEKIQQSPCLECECELDAEFEKKVYAYYGLTEFAYKAMEADLAQRELRRISRSGNFPKPVETGMPANSSGQDENTGTDGNRG